jgi:hypothetical protein
MEYFPYMLRVTILLTALTFGLINNILNGQLIDNSKCNAFTDEPFFNSQIVYLNHLKSLHGVVSTKKELSAIRNTGKVLHFEFNKQGELKKQYSTFYRQKKKDTTYIFYEYENKGELATKRTNDINGFYSYNYTYNDAQLLIKKTYCRDENAIKSRTNFILKKQYVIINEEYNYKKEGSSLIKNILNNNKLPYQRVEYKYDALGYLVSETKKLLINNKKSIVKYTYNEHGLLDSKKIIKDLKKDTFRKLNYKYDSLGNLIELNEYNNDKHITHKEILYDEKTYLLKALIIQDVETNFIKIIKFKASFY